MAVAVFAAAFEAVVSEDCDEEQGGRDTEDAEDFEADCEDGGGEEDAEQ